MKLNFFNFKSFEDEILLTNDFGEHIFLKNEEFHQLISKSVQQESDLEKKLI